MNHYTSTPLARRPYLAHLLSVVALAALAACGGGGSVGEKQAQPQSPDPTAPDATTQDALLVVALQSLTPEQEIDRLRQLGMSVVPLDDSRIVEESGDEESFEFVPVDMPTADAGAGAQASDGRARALSTTAGERRATPMIVGGSTSQPGQFPFFARLTISNGTRAAMCSGSVIDANWILTAAHCTPTTTSGSISVYLGFGSLAKTPETIPADYYVKLPNDQALVHLSRPTTYPKIPYANSFSTTAVPVRTVGTGVESYGSTAMGVYKFVDSSAISLSTAYPGYFVLGTPGSMSTSCSGDSGGPNLLYSSGGFPYAIGVTSATLFPYCTGQALITRLDLIASSIESTTGEPAMQFNLANNPPTIQQIQPLETPLQYTELQVVASDPEGDEILYEAKGLPPGLTIHRLTGLIRGTPTSYTLAGQPNQTTVTVYDKTTGASRSITFPWRINTPGNLIPRFDVDTVSRTIVAGQSVSVQFTAVDPDDTSIQYSATGLPPGVTISPTGLVSGTPAAGGVFQANIVAVDGRGGYASVPFLLTVQNTAPLIQPIADVTSAPGATNVRFTLGVTDAESHALTASASTLPLGVVFNASTLEFSGAPKAAGAYPISVRISDSYGGSSSRTFMWYASAANNTAPTMTPLANTSSLPGVAVSIPLTGMSDAEGHAMTLTFRNLPLGIRYNATTKALAGKPTLGGIYNVEYTIADAYGAKTTYPPMVWTIPNQSPTMSGPSAITLMPGVAATVPYNLSDPENHPLSVAAVGLPRGLLFNVTTKAITGTPFAGGVFNVTLTASDRYGGKAATVTTVITVPNEAPVVSGTPPNQTIVLGTLVNQPLSVTDPENHTITISALPRTLPPGLSINQTTRSITGKPSAVGTYIVRLVATDRYGAVTNFPAFTLTTTNSAPVWGALADQTSYQGSAVNVPMPVSDPDGHTMVVSSTSLPLGLRVSGTSIIGTPTAPPGTYTVTLYVKDQYGLFASVAKNIRWTIAAPG